MIVLVVICYLLLAVFEFVPLYKQKLWPDLCVNTALWTLSFIVAGLISLDINIPSPASSIREVITSLFGK
jgi:hypothetical protein